MRVKSFIMLFTMIIVVAIASVSMASDEELVAERLQNIFTETLNLSDAQETELRSVFDDRAEAFERLINKYKDDGFVGLRRLRDDIDDFLGDTEPLFDDLLTEEQLDLLRQSDQLEETLVQAVKDEVRDALVNDLLGDLKLQDVQIDSIRTILKDDVEKRQALFEKYQGKGPRELRSFRKDLNALRNETERRLKGVLSSEQLDAFRDLHDDLGERLRKKLFRR